MAALMTLKVITVATYDVVVTVTVTSVTSTGCRGSGIWPQKEDVEARVVGSSHLRI